MIIDHGHISGVQIVQAAPKIDQRGVFTEVWRRNIGDHETQPQTVRQVNTVYSNKGAVRGLHAYLRPPGQVKYVHCLHGRIRDVVVDIRPESDTFGRYALLDLDAKVSQGIVIPAGVAHGYSSLKTAVVLYLTDRIHSPSLEVAVNPFDTALGIDWGVSNPLISERDREAPTLQEVVNSGVLVTHANDGQ